MATALPRAALGRAPGEAGIVYGKRDNITVPGTDAADPALTTVETAAAARETDRAPGFTPEAGDYTADPSERAV